MKPSNLQNITLVIPTFNRHSHLIKLIKYYAAKNTHMLFLILDSSDPDTVQLNSDAFAVMGDRAQHIVFPSSMPVATKLLNGLKLVATEFCAFCADDDLVFIEGLTQALAYLQQHPDYVCVDGIYLNFYQTGNDIQLKVEYGSKGMDADHPGARVFKLYQKYESLFYGVFRTSDITNIFAGVSKISSLHYQELFQATAALLIGKSHRLPIFYAARQHCDPAEAARDKWQTYYWFADNRMEFLEHYVIYREELWQFYQRHTPEAKLSQDAFCQAMDLAHAVFFGTGCPPEYFHSVLQPHWPTDTFTKPNPKQDDICHQLKKSHQQLWDANFEKFVNFLQKKISTFFAKQDISSLNRKTQKNTNTHWNCVLTKELRWLAGVENFRKTYQELCSYLS